MAGAPIDLEEVWRIREEEVYPKLFGAVGRGIFVLSQALFQDRFKQSNIDPRWLFYGVIEFPPTAQRSSWVYVTSGHSNPWESEQASNSLDDLSGAGVELLLATTQQGEWAINALLNILAFDLLLSVNRYPGKSPLAPGDRVPLNSPINGHKRCLIRNVLVSQFDSPWPGFTLPSGSIRFLVLTGATDKEINYAKATSTHQLVDALRLADCYPETNPHRPSVF